MTAPTEHHTPTFAAIRQHAINAAKVGIAVLPLYAFDEGDIAGSRGKRPRMMDWQKSKLTEAEATKWWDRHPRSNMGVICGEKSGLICLDIDPRAGGMEWAKENESLLLACSSAKEVSGRGDGGFHLWFAHPGTPVRSGKLAPGVDLKADGGHQVVVAPSVHAATGECYRWEGGISEAADLSIYAPSMPEWLLNLAGQMAPMKERRPVREGELHDDPYDIETYRAWLAEREQPVINQGANVHILHTAFHGRDLALMPATAVECMLEWCQNGEIPAREIEQIVKNAYRYGKEDPGAASVRVFDTAPVDMPPIEETQLTEEAAAQVAETRAEIVGMSWHADLTWVYKVDKETGVQERVGIMPSLHNAACILTHHTGTRGAFCFDEFSLKVLVRRPLPWSKDKGPRELTDHDANECRIWLEKLKKAEDKVGTVFPKEIVWDAIVSVAHRAKTHPVRAYLNGLSWDGTPRLDGWLSETYGLDDSPLHKGYARRALIAAVARVMDPGCQVDTVLILEGEQGYYKTQGLKVLAAPWTKELHGDVQNKDFLLALRGAWIVEIGELSSFNRAEANHLKALISCRTDSVRDPYARATCEVKRQCIWVGTTNAEHYLTDTTGNRRFWPVRVERKGNLDWLRANRDQLWAEAKSAYSAGEQWWLTDTEEAASQVQVEERMGEDPLTETVRRAVDGDGEMIPRVDVVGINEVLTRCGFIGTKANVHEARKVGICLRSLGWERRRAYVDGAQTRMWYRN